MEASSLSNHKRLWLSAVLVAGLVGCAGNPLSIKPIPVTADPSAQLSAFSDEVELARQNKVAILSPSWFSKAESSLAAATEIRDDGGAVQNILASVAKGRAQLEEARKYAEISKMTFATVLKAREDARVAGATSLGQRYTEVEDQFVELTAAVEGDNMSWAQRNSASIEKSFRSVELTAIQETTGNRIKDLIKKARSEDAEKFAPTLLSQTESQFQGLEDFIRKNRYASAEIGERAKDALFQANRLLHFTREAKALARETSEAQLLKQEQRLASVGVELALPDSGDQTFADRFEQLTLAARELKRDRDSLVQRVDSLRSEAATLQEKIVSLEGRSSEERKQLAALEGQRRFDELFNEVSAEFDKQDAEVYKQGSKLVIRLRSIDFPVGQYVLQPPSYALLSKVQQAIRAFGAPSVVIEGHTDSTGSKELNDHLSQKRAEAVADYLVANNTLPRENITAVGRGYSVPLASNSTADGRTQNRRIDIVVDAQRIAATPAVSSGK